MSKSKHLALIEEFKAVHDKYLETVSNYEPPDERKKVIDESINAFNGYLSKAESGELDDEKLEAIIKAIKTSEQHMKYPKGFCSIDCLKATLKAQDLVVMTAAKSNIPPEVVVALEEMTSSMLADTVCALLALASSDEKPWETKKKAHDIKEASTKIFMDLVDAIKAGRVLTMKLPTADKKKDKHLWN